MADRTWLITGVSSGIGLELAEELLTRGDRVHGTVRRMPELGAPLHAVARHPSMFLHRLDVTDTARMRRVVADVWRQHPIDIVVSNAGYALFGAAETLADEEIDRQLATNLTASIHLARAVIPRMRKRGRGHLVQLSSMGGRIAFPGISLYHATKWGIEGFFESVAREVAEFGLGVTLVEPGTVTTAFTGRSARFGRFDEAYGSTTVAGAVVEPLRAAAADVNETQADAEPVGDDTPIVGSDAALVARAIADLADSDAPPFRLPLGSDAFAAVSAHLDREMTALRAMSDIAASTDHRTPVRS